MNRPTISILIPTFNRSKYLEHLLSFILDEIYNLDYSYEIVISNNASTDGTLHVVDKFKDSLQLRSFTQDTNIGAFKNASFLINEARGLFYIHLADDDLVDFELLNICLNKLQSNDNAVALYTPWQVFDYKKKETLTLFYKSPESVIKRNDYKGLCEFIIENKIFPEIGVFRTDMLKKMFPIYYEHFFFAFKYPLEFLSQGDIIFTNVPYHKSLCNFKIDNEGYRHQEGWDAKFLFNTYRNSLNHYLRIINTNSNRKNDISKKIDEFIIERLHVSYKIYIRLGEFIEAYEVGSMILGEFGILNSPHDHKTICLYAKFDYLKRICLQYGFNKIIIIYDKNLANSSYEKTSSEEIKKFFEKTNDLIDVIDNPYTYAEKCIFYVLGKPIINLSAEFNIHEDSKIIEDYDLTSKFI